MANRILLLYGSVDGQTLKISKVIRDQLQKGGEDVFLCDISDFDKDLSGFNKIIIGSSIRYGVHHKAIIEFINQQKASLEKHKSIFFSVNLVARKPEKNQANTNPYVIKFFNQISWKPDLVEVFAGKLDYKKYPFFDRIMIQFIMWMTKGPTDPNAKIEYTDWDKVKAFGQNVLAM